MNEEDFVKIVVCRLFNDTFSVPRNILRGVKGDRQVNDELKRIWKEPAVASFKVLSVHLPGVTEVIHENPQSG
jgi:hypothetical protein